ncbi:hypothetical protein MTO96_035261 [Rhipicephalus appendiculatus]
MLISWSLVVVRTPYFACADGQQKVHIAACTVDSLTPNLSAVTFMDYCVARREELSELFVTVAAGHTFCVQPHPEVVFPGNLCGNHGSNREISRLVHFF